MQTKKKQREKLNRLANHEVDAFVWHNLVQIAWIALQLHQQTAKRCKNSQSMLRKYMRDACAFVVHLDDVFVAHRVTCCCVCSHLNTLPCITYSNLYLSASVS